MAQPVYTKKTTTTGQVQYRKDGNLVKKDELDEVLLARIDAAPEGTEVPESAEVEATDDNVAPAPEKGEKTEKIHLERNIMINGKVYRGGYEREYDEVTGELVAETPVEIDVPADISEDLKRIDRENTTYERNLLRGQNLANNAPQVKDVKEHY